MKLIIVSGLSGSGKTIALHTLEDAGYFCVDNLPVGMLPDFVDRMINVNSVLYDMIAVAIDARSGIDDMERFDEIINEINMPSITLEILFLTTDVNRLLSRFSETRRRHPLSRQGLPLIESIHLERNLLKNINARADLTIDTSKLNVHELRKVIIQRLLPDGREGLALLIQSFGYKHGLPVDSDFIFDVRCLPNPHWESKLKSLTGKDPAVVKFLEKFDEVNRMYKSINDFLTTWIPCFEKENRSYMTISIGCTGGQHRSVFLVEKIAAALINLRHNISKRHRELE